MARTGMLSPRKFRNEAEGSPDPSEAAEPANPLRTTTVPAIRGFDYADSPTAQTGLAAVVNQSVEGFDKDDSQDASRTVDERHAHNAQETASMDDEKRSPVLIVEDTVELAEVIQATLEDMGLQVIHATHGKIGLEKLKALRPNLILMDIGLPDITGWKLLDYIKEYATSTETRMPTIIVITAYGDPANRLIGKLQNIHSYLIKPFTPDQVEYLVTLALRGEQVPPSIDNNDELHTS